MPMKPPFIAPRVILAGLAALSLAGPAAAQPAPADHADHANHASKSGKDHKAVKPLGGIKLSASLTGSVETPSGDPDGTGQFTARLNPGHSQLCYTLTSAMIAAPTAAHIHIGKAGEAGPPVVPLAAQAATETCVAIDKAVADKILADPASYYVNVHNAEFPGGAVRGQLSKG
jgi:hypothetical protein